jgi:hypothetical protein
MKGATAEPDEGNNSCPTKARIEPGGSSRADMQLVDQPGFAPMLRVLHLIPGRARLRFDAVKGHPELGRRLHTHLEAVAQIKRVTVDTRTGSVLLLYDARALKTPAFLDEISEALSKIFPNHFAPGRLRVTIRQLKGKPELARILEMRLAPVHGIRHIEIDPTNGSCQLVYDSTSVTSPVFLDALSDALRTFLPRSNLKKLLTLAGFRWR